MRRSASEIIRNLEMRVAHLENRSASTKKIKNPILVRIDEVQNDKSTSQVIQLFCRKSELKNIQGYGEMHNGEVFDVIGQIEFFKNPMCSTRIVFDEADFGAFLKGLSRTYTLIEEKA